MKEQKLQNIFNKNVTKILLFIVNVGVLIFLLYYIVAEMVMPKAAEREMISSKETTSMLESNAQEEQIMSSDADLAAMCCDYLAGINFTSEDGLRFCFEDEGGFSGFYDTSNPDVIHYSYDVQVVGTDIMLNIYDADKQNVVCYKMEFLNNGDIQLTYLENGKSLVLVAD